MKMYRSLTAAIFASGVLAAGNVMAAPENYVVDETHSFVDFKISHLGFSYLKGRFNDLSGSFVHDAEKPGSNAITMEVKTASIDSNHAERDRHLRGRDFLDVAKYPSASFKTTGFEADGEGGVLSGDLTLYGNTKPIKIDVTFIGAGQDPWGGYRRGYSGKTTIAPQDWGMKYKLGPAAETMELEFIIEGVRQ